MVCHSSCGGGERWGMCGCNVGKCATVGGGGVCRSRMCVVCMHCVVICLLWRRFLACRYAVASVPVHGLEGGAGRGGRLHATLALRSCLPVLRSLVAVLPFALLGAEALVELEPGVAAWAVLRDLLHEQWRHVGLDAAFLDLELGKLVEVLRDHVRSSLLDLEVDVPFALLWDNLLEVLLLWLRLDADLLEGGR